VKRRHLLRKLSGAGFVLVRTKGPHDVLRRGDLAIAVPRHREIKEYLARKVLREAGF
jgi:predicted RNA binding protein YcfA (HicA-like mRNA interferase family)